jgi:hypothetical protein
VAERLAADDGFRDAVAQRGGLSAAALASELFRFDEEASYLLAHNRPPPLDWLAQWDSWLLLAPAAAG